MEGLLTKNSYFLWENASLTSMLALLERLARLKTRRGRPPTSSNPLGKNFWGSSALVKIITFWAIANIFPQKVSESVIDKCVCKTAPATVGLLTLCNVERVHYL